MSPEIESVLQPINTAPLDRDVVVFNKATGPYRSRATQIRQSPQLQWPLRNWNGMDGIWYPIPSHWAPLDIFEPDSVSVGFEQVNPILKLQAKTN